MNPEIHPPHRHLAENRNWRRTQPRFSLLACLVALICGAALFAYQYKIRWAPLERFYFPTYFRTAHLVNPRNPYLRPSHTLTALFIVYPRETRLAVDREVVPVPPPLGASSKVIAFALSDEAVHSSAKRLEWRRMRLDDRWLHAWLGRWIYGGRTCWQLVRPAWYAFLLALAVFFPLAVRKDLSEGRKRRQGRPLKGADVITRTQFHRRYRHFVGIGWLTKDAPGAWERLHIEKQQRAMVRVARRNEWEHFLLVGATGSGKSSLIRQMLIQIAQRGETAIVYDPAREYLPQFLNPDRGDAVLNPLDARMPQWNPSDELLHYSEADAIAKSFYPDRDRENRFFVESPRKIFAYLLKFHPTPHELCDWIAYADPEIDKRVAKTALEPIISKSAPQQRSGVLSGLEKVVSAFTLLPEITDRNRQWTATRWAETRQGWIFLTSTTSTREALRPLLRLWMDLLILRLVSQNEYGQRPVWVILDELSSLETLPTLAFALSESRKSNVRMVLGLQGRSQVEALYGREAEAMLSQPRTKIFMRTTEPRAAEWASKCIGDVEIEHLRESWSRSEWGLQQSDTAAIDRRIETAILASEIANLDDLEGYLQGPGYTLKVKFPYFHPEMNHPGIILRNAVEPGPVPSMPPNVPPAIEPEQKALASAPSDVPNAVSGKWRANETPNAQGDTFPVTS